MIPAKTWFIDRMGDIIRSYHIDACSHPLVLCSRPTNVVVAQLNDGTANTRLRRISNGFLYICNADICLV